MFEAYSMSDVAVKFPQEISSLCCRKATNSVLAGNKDGTMFSHKLSNRGGASLQKYEFEYICKKFERNTITNMTICEEKNLILCTSQGLLSAHILNDPQHLVINVLLTVKPIQSFAIWIREDDDDLYIIASSKRKLHLFRWIDKDFLEIPLECTSTFSDNPVNLQMCKNNLVFNVREDYFIATLKCSIVDEKEAWDISTNKFANSNSSNSSNEPIILYIYDINMIGIMRNEVLCFMHPDPEDEKRPVMDIRFSEVPVALVYDPPYIVAVLNKGRIEVRSFNPSILVQHFTLGKPQFICCGNRGQVYVSGSSNGNNRIWVLDSTPNLHKNVSTLIQEKHFDLAIQIVEMSKAYTEENKIEIKRQAATNLFNQKKFEESFQLHMQIGTNVIQVIHLIPDLIPDVGKNILPSGFSELPANDKKRALLAMGNYLSAKRTEYVKLLDPKFTIGMSKDDIQNTRRTLIIIDTTLLNCYLQTKPILVDSLLRLHNNSCKFEVAEAILKKANKLPSLFVLYETRKKHELALELVWTQSQLPEADSFFEGNERIIEYLQTLGNTHLELIFNYADKIFKKNEEEGLSIFTGEESDVARSLDREKVLEFLKDHCSSAVIPYLEHVIYKWEENRPKFHEALLEFYIDKVKKLMIDYVHVFKDDENITRAGEEEGDLGVYRKKLMHFLQFSLQYNPQGIYFQLNGTELFQERALVYGRLKMHEQALTIYISILNDFQSAENYCQLYYDKHDTINSQVYLQWLRGYIKPYDPHKAGLTENLMRVPPPDVPSAIKVLSRHADKIDTVSALIDFPDEIELRTLSLALIAVLQTVHDNAVSLEMRESVLFSALNHAKTRLKALESTTVLITSSSECSKCNKKIGQSAFVRTPDGESLIHFGCST